MGTFIIENWLIVLPTALTGIYLLRLMQKIYKQRQKPQPVPVTIRNKD